MKRYLVFLTFVMAFVANAFGAKVSAEQAMKIAERYMLGKGRIVASASMAKAEGLSKDKQQEAYYVFNAADDKGFVIVAGNDTWGSIIGYSDSGSFSLDGAPEGLKNLMQMYSLLMKDDASTETSMPQKAEAGEPVVEPLLADIAWGQGAPFNNLCPTYTEQRVTNHYYVGCVATAMAQIMKYHGYPVQGRGTKSYQSNGSTLTADFGATTYDWDSMLYNYVGAYTTEQANAVAMLCQHLGVAVEMTYEVAGSGAYSQYVASALRDYFGYSSSTTYVARNYFSTTEWMTMLKNELDASRPVFYSASSDAGTGGHAFVADGYDSNDFVHINWGWNGMSNGYFMINALNPSELGTGGGSGGYNLAQEMVIGIQPVTEGDKEGVWPLYSPTRMTYVDYGTAYQLMAFVENDETAEFNGEIAAVLAKNGEIVKVLKTQPLKIDGVTQSSRINIDTEVVKVEDVPKTASDVADGDYQLRYAARTAGGEWFIVRHPQGLPAYIDAHVTSGNIVASTHVMKPDVTLLSRIEPDGEVYANGIAKFTMTLKNNSVDMPLTAIRLLLKPLDGGEGIVLADKLGGTKVYEESTKTVTILCDLPTELSAGDYIITAFEAKYEDDPFSEEEVGVSQITVLPATDYPVIRNNSPFVLSVADGAELRQGETLAVAAYMRNYSVDGKVGVLLKLRDATGKERPFYLVEKSFLKGEMQYVQFARRADFDPGTYDLTSYYITDDGEEHAMADADDTPVQITIAENPDLALVCEDMTLPAEIVKGEKYSCTVTLRAQKDFNRTFYIRLRQFTNTNGEIVYMKSGLSMKAGEVTTLTFSYKTALENGSYMPIVETKVNSSTYEPVGGFAAYDKDYVVVDESTTDGISQLGSTMSSDTYYNLSGQRVSHPQHGLYIIGGRKIVR